jgi:hypothetical protein
MASSESMKGLSSNTQSKLHIVLLQMFVDSSWQRQKYTDGYPLQIQYKISGPTLSLAQCRDGSLQRVTASQPDYTLLIPVSE